MIEKVTDRKSLREFVYFTAELYDGENRYAPPFYRVLYKELKREVLEKARYTALLAKKEGAVRGRILFTTEYNEKEKRKVGYFSMFDVFDEPETAAELLAEAEKLARKKRGDFGRGSLHSLRPRQPPRYSRQGSGISCDDFHFLQLCLLRRTLGKSRLRKKLRRRGFEDRVAGRENGIFKISGVGSA